LTPAALPPGADLLIVFLKAPRPGAVKTRLADDLDGPAAEAIYRVLLERTCAAAQAASAVEVRFSPEDAATEVQPWIRPGWHAAPQGAGDLGERLVRAFDEAFARGAAMVIVIGSDCPALEPADLESARAALRDHDVVVGPAEDGGYWLIGLRAHRPALFQSIPWSTNQVLDATLRHAQEGQLRVHQLRTLRDIDTLEDWRHWLRSRPL
jgi:rSAM/selenodomain-associated transferase 1